MNNKIEIWKRKLAKEKWKNQKAVWEKLNDTKKVRAFPEPFSLDEILQNKKIRRMDKNAFYKFMLGAFNEDI